MIGGTIGARSHAPELPATLCFRTDALQLVRLVMDNAQEEELKQLLDAFGYEPEEDQQIQIGITVAVHSALADDPESIRCELLHFGQEETEHIALHSLAETIEQILRAQHEEAASQN